MKTHNGYVYCIHCNITGDNYVGSTRNTINIRMRSHKCKANKCQSKHILARGDYTVEVLEVVFDNDLIMREKYYMNNTEQTINKVRCGVTEEERKESARLHHIENNERINENLRNHRKYQQTWGDCIAKRHRDTPHNLLLIDTNIFD